MSDDKKQGRGRIPAANGLFFVENSPYDLDEFHKQVVDIGDATCYKAAIQLLTHVPESQRWGVWKGLLSNSKFANRVELMVDEINMKYKSDAIAKLVSSNSDAAARFVAISGWEEKTTQASRAKAAKEAAKDIASTKEDMARILAAISEDA